MTAPTATVRRRSYSQLSTYRDCPHCYWHKYVLREPEQPAVWSVGGTAFHTCAEWLLRGDLGQPDELRIANAWQVAWQLEEQEIREKNPLAADLPIEKWRAAARGAEDARWWSWHGPQMVRDLVAWRQATAHQLTVLPVGDQLAIEHRIECQLGGVPAVAIPDLLVIDEHGQLCILDWKSGKPPKDSLQLHVYRAAARKALGLDATWGLYYMTRAARIIPVPLDRWSPDDVDQLFAEFDAQIAAGVFTANPDCKFCPCLKKTKKKERCTP